MSTVFELVQTVKQWHSQHEEVEGPIIVVDKFGGTEAATFCALMTLNDQLQHEACVDIYYTAKLYHLKRPGIWPRKVNQFSHIVCILRVVLDKLSSIIRTVVQVKA